MKILPLCFLLIATCCFAQEQHRSSVPSNMPRPLGTSRMDSPHAGPNQRLVQFLLRPEVAKDVGVSDATLATIQAEYDKLAPEQEKLRNELREKMKSNYQLAINTLTTKTADLKPLVDETKVIGELRTAIAVLDVKKIAILRDNLTPAQITKLLALIKEKMPPPPMGALPAPVVPVKK